MTKKATKKGSQAALRQSHTAKFVTPETLPGESDPPIIVSGGSVTITSKVKLDYRPSPDGRHIYTTDKLKVKKIKTKGKKNEEDEPKPDGKFTIELWG